MQQERRDLPRLVIGREAKIKLDGSDGAVSCHIRDIHLKGMCLKMPQQILQNHALKMVVTIGDGVDLDLEVDVSWSRMENREHVYGLAFVKIPDDDKDKVSEYINRHCTKQIRQKWWE